MRASDLALILQGEFKGSNTEIRRFSIDSRKVKEGETFIAIKGERRDGHSFVEEAFKKGAVGAIVERDFNPVSGRFIIKVESTFKALYRIALFKREQFKGVVTAVAGSAGKTTTKELVYHLISYVDNAYRSEGNFNSRIGLPLTLANMDITSGYAIFELGASQKGDVLKLTKLVKPKVRIITAIGEEHLETFGSLKDIIEGNGEIFHNFGSEDTAIIPYYLRETYKLPPSKVITFGTGGNLQAENIRLSLEGTSFIFKGQEFTIKVLNKSIVDCSLAAFGFLIASGYDPREFRDRLGEFLPPKGRMNILNFGDFFIIDDTYNANPLSMKNALKTLGDLNTTSKKIVVIGDMLELGNKSETLHREIGCFTAQCGIDFAIFFGSDMIFAYEEYTKKGGRGIMLKKREDVLEEILKWLKDKNIILLKGSRGMQMDKFIEELKEIIYYG